MRTTFHRLMVAMAVLLWRGPYLFAEEDALGQTQTPALQFVLSACSLIVIMVILCMPSRKRQNERKT
jgi:hypothetical protein